MVNYRKAEKVGNRKKQEFKKIKNLKSRKSEKVRNW